jgi:hypothetical protein
MTFEEGCYFAAVIDLVAVSFLSFRAPRAAMRLACHAYGELDVLALCSAASRDKSHTPGRRRRSQLPQAVLTPETVRVVGEKVGDRALLADGHAIIL